MEVYPTHSKRLIIPSRSSLPMLFTTAFTRAFTKRLVALAPNTPHPPLQVSFTNLNMLPAPTSSSLYIPLIIGLPNTLHEVSPIPHKRLP